MFFFCFGIRLKKRNSITVAPTHFKLCRKIGFHETQCTGVPFSSRVECAATAKIYIDVFCIFVTSGGVRALTITRLTQCIRGAR